MSFHIWRNAPSDRVAISILFSTRRIKFESYGSSEISHDKRMPESRRILDKFGSRHKFSISSLAKIIALIERVVLRNTRFISSTARIKPVIISALNSELSKISSNPSIIKTNFLLRYSVKNHRNLLVAPDSFAYLFEDSDLENRTKSGFILLAKDLKNKYGIPILIVRPKAMLTKNYVNVPPEIEQEFLAAFGNYATPLGFVSDRVEASRNPSRGSDIRIRNHGKIYSVQMGELWENHFANYYFWNEPRHAYYFP